MLESPATPSNGVWGEWTVIATLPKNNLGLSKAPTRHLYHLIVIHLCFMIHILLLVT